MTNTSKYPYICLLLHFLLQETVYSVFIWCLKEGVSKVLKHCPFVPYLSKSADFGAVIGDLVASLEMSLHAIVGPQNLFILLSLISRTDG